MYGIIKLLSSGKLQVCSDCRSDGFEAVFNLIGSNIGVRSQEVFVGVPNRDSTINYYRGELIDSDEEVEILV
jgi:hypothetical protein